MRSLRLALPALLTLPTLLIAQVKGKPQHASFDTPEGAADNKDFELQGEYAGTMRDQPFALQVVALGDGSFDAVLCPGGLPGAGWTKQPNPRQHVMAKRDDESVRFSGNGWNGLLKKTGLFLQDFKGNAIGTLKRTDRTSPSIGEKAPAGAKVLFDGLNTEAFKPGARMTADKLLMEGCTTKEEFGDCKVHIEFRTPFMPTARGQGRGNSGIYLAGRYEVQMLDSFGLNGENNECGGIYTVAKPIVNMALPPLTWQTYDIEFTAPKFDAENKKTADAEITVTHNGVLIHDHVKIPGPTAAAPLNTPGAKGPIHLQNHGNPMRYRNFWVLPK